MKKITSLLLAFSLLMTVTLCSVNAENENLNDIFEIAADRTQFISMGEVALGERFSPNSIFNYTNMWTSYDDKYGLEEGSYQWTDENGVTHIEYWQFAIPAEMFENEIRKYFVLDETDIEALHTIEEYNSETNTYKTNRTGIGDSTTYIPYGYTDNGGDTYTFYAFYIDQADIDVNYSPNENEVLNQDYTIYSGSYCQILHILRTTLSYDGQYVRFLSYERNVTEVPDESEVIRPEGSVINSYLEDLNIYSYDTVFPNNTIVTINPVNNESGIKDINDALPDTIVISAFDISANNNDTSIQPDGPVCVRYYIPEDYVPETQSYNMYYIDDNGNAEKLSAIIIRDSYSIYVIFTITHFSTYALVLENIPQEQTALDIVDYNFVYGIKSGDNPSDYSAAKFVKNDTALKNDELIGTGCTVMLNSYQEYTAIVMGDPSGDGEINSTDFMQIRRQFLGIYAMDEAQSLAADVTGDGTINSTDFMQIRKHFLGVFNLYD